MIELSSAEASRAALGQALFVLTGTRATGPASGQKVFRIATNADVDSLEPLVADCPDELVVLVDAGWPWRRGIRWRSGARAILRRVQTLAVQQGRPPGIAYMLWPSATEPAYLVPVSGRHAFVWLRRSGVLAGGRTSAMRFLVRQPMVDGLLWWSCPAAAIVVPPQ